MNFKLIAAAGLCVAACNTALAQQLSITSVSISKLGRNNLCAELGGAGEPPRITIRHAKASGTLSIAMEDRLNNGRVIDHRSTSATADASGTTVVTYNFLPPCNRRTAEGLKSAYYVTVSGGSASKTVLWGRYP